MAWSERAPQKRFLEEVGKTLELLVVMKPEPFDQDLHWRCLSIASNQR